MVRAVRKRKAGAQTTFVAGPAQPGRRPRARYREYNSTTSDSLTSWATSGRSGVPLNLPSSFFGSTSTHDGKPRLLGQRQRLLDAALLLGLLAHGDHVAGLDQHRRDSGGLAVQRDRAVTDQLARLGARRPEAHPVDDVVEPRLQQHQQVLAGVALAARGFLVVAAELALEDAVHALQLLLLAQLRAVVRLARARDAAVLARLAVRLGLRVEGAARALQEEIGALAARELEFGSCIACHVRFPFILRPGRIKSRPSGPRRLAVACLCLKKFGRLRRRTFSLQIRRK